MSNPNPTRRNSPNRRFSIRAKEGMCFDGMSTLDALNFVQEMKPGDTISITRIK